MGSGPFLMDALVCSELRGARARKPSQVLLPLPHAVLIWMALFITGLRLGRSRCLKAFVLTRRRACGATVDTGQS